MDIYIYIYIYIYTHKHMFMHFYTYIYNWFTCTAETNTIWKINFIPIKLILKEKLKMNLKKNQNNYCAADNSNKIEKGYIYLSTLSLGVQLE